MEVAPGLFASSRVTTDWMPDPDVPGTEVHELVHADGVWAGLTRILEASRPLPWTPDQRETIFVIEGSVRIETADGTILDLGPGDIASLPPGIATTWHVITPFMEMWVIA